MKTILTFLVVGLFLNTAFLKEAKAIGGVSLIQIHNPTGPSDGSGNEAASKSQFVIQNTSTPGINITSIFWQFASPIFIDSAAGAPGFGSFRNYAVSPAQTYGTVSDPFQITVLSNSDVLTGYVGPTSFVDGATSLLQNFNNFNPSEAFGFWTDLDTLNNTTGRVNNADLNGSKTTVQFSDGSSLVLDWVLPNNNGRTAFCDPNTTSGCVKEIGRAHV